jgi:hypothetical protein
MHRAATRYSVHADDADDFLNVFVFRYLEQKEMAVSRSNIFLTSLGRLMTYSRHENLSRQLFSHTEARRQVRQSWCYERGTLHAL